LRTATGGVATCRRGEWTRGGLSHQKEGHRGVQRDGVEDGTLRHDSLYTYLQWTVRRFWAVSGP